MRVLGGGKAVLFGAAALVGLCAGTLDTASAQALSPMRGEVRSFADEFVLRVRTHNPKGERMAVAMRAYDHRFEPIRARFSRSSFMLGGEASRTVTVIVPFEGVRERFVRVCAETIALRTSSHSVRTRVCGKYRALRR